MQKAFVSILSILVCSATALAQNDAAKLQRALAYASRTSTLTLPGSAPFHLKLSAKDLRHDAPEYRAEIELWWAGPEEWRREVRSTAFSQTAVRHAEYYSESNSSDYLPFWLHELIQESVEPIPLSELVRENVELTRAGCAEWQEPYKKQNDTAYVHQSICFNSDLTLRELFTPTVRAQLGNYKEFNGKKIAGSIMVWPSGLGDILATVTTLEPLKPTASLSQIADKTPYPARLRFVSAPETALELDMEQSSPLVWPVVHNFPASGVMAVEVKLDRTGSVKEIGTIVATNFVLTGTAREQIKKWKFKPYLIDGAPVQVSATLAVHFDARVEFLGKGGNSLPAIPFLERMKLSRQLSSPRSSGSVPFQMHATIEGKGGQKGSYTETWTSPENWTRAIQLGAKNLQLVCENGQISQKPSGSKSIPPDMAEILELLTIGHFPDRHYTVYEADWGQSTVTFSGTDAVRVARGRVDADNQPIDGQAYWFNAAGLLLGDYEEPLTTTYSEFTLWKEKQIPRRLEVREKGTRKWLVTVDKLEPAP